MKTHIVTGAVGFVGENLVRELLNRGDNVILFIRDKDGISARDRAMQVFDFDKATLKRVRVFDIDLLSPICEQVSVTELKEVFGPIHNIWHLAAFLSFKEKYRNITIKTNVDGTKNMSILAKELGAHLFYFSTAYVHGNRSGILMEDEIIRSTYNNPYEESKYLAEKYLNEQIDFGLRLTVFRPSIIFDESPHNRQGHVSGYYVLLKSIRDVRNKLVNFITSHRILSFLLGLYIDENGIVVSKYIPINVTSAKINLISVQNVLKVVFCIYDNQYNKCGLTYHIASPYGINIGDVFSTTLDVLKIRTRIICVSPSLVNIFIALVRYLGKFMPSLFAGFARKMQYYRFYLVNTREFDFSNVYCACGEKQYKSLFKGEGHMLRIAAKRFLAL